MSTLFENIKNDVIKKVPRLRKTNAENLATLAETILKIQSVNTSEIAAAIPRNLERFDMREQWVLRTLGNKNIDHFTIMKPYIMEVLQNVQDEQIVFMIDQTHINKDMELLMISMRFKERAIPFIWKAVKTQGNIGFSYQLHLLNFLKELIPAHQSIVLMGDRFYGSPELIQWCQMNKWSYRLRLKGNLCVYQGMNAIKTGDLPMGSYENITLTGKRVHTNIGVIHDDGHPEAWIIAMDCSPNAYKTLDYGMRWGIESLFSDFKSRGFGLAQSQIRIPENLERLVLVLSIALYWAVSTGLWYQKQHPLHGSETQKNRSRLSCFKTGMRYFRMAFNLIAPVIPSLWAWI